VPREHRRLWGDVASDAIVDVVVDADATLVEIHSEDKEEAAPHFKGDFGLRPILATCDTTGEVLAAELRPGNAGADSAIDQLDPVDRCRSGLRWGFCVSTTSASLSQAV